MKGKTKLHILYKYQLNIYLTVDSNNCKNEPNRPCLSSHHLRNQSSQTCYNSAIFQYFCMKLSDSLKNRKNPYCGKLIFDLGLRRKILDDD